MISLNRYGLPTLVVCSLLLWLQESVAQSVSTCQQALRIIKTADKHHIEPKVLDDTFSEDVFNATLRALDPDKLLITRAEATRLAPFKYTLDEAILRQDCSFVIRLTQLYEKKLQFADSLLHRFRDEQINVHQIDSLTFQKDQAYLERQPLTERWRKQMRLRLLLTSLADSSHALLPSRQKWDSLYTLVVDRERCKINARLHDKEGVEQHVASTFLKALASAYDPHTVYFTPAEEQEFERMLSGEALAYGFQLTKNDDGDIEIARIEPGGPAWKSGLLNEGDIVLEATTPSGAVMNFSCTSLKDVLEFLADEHDEMSFSVRKRDGQQVTVTLPKEKIDVEENVIQSFLLKKDNTIGYIYLPSFYSRTEGGTNSSQGCANDVARELIKLKREGISGLVVDLRNNGGGSMTEALQLAGLFIDYGALTILRTRDEPLVTLKDSNRGTVYDGPVIVLLNAFSASATELFAATLQDYHRALIVGSPSFGKSTSQQIIPLGINSSEGYLKLTTGRFYRVTGQSHQQTGVYPDIWLPSLYDDLPVGEKDYPTALAPSTVTKKTYFSPASPLPTDTLRAHSAQRVSASRGFDSIKTANRWLLTTQQAYTVPLAYDAFLTYYQTSPYAALRHRPSVSELDTTLLVENPSYLRGMSSATDGQQEINEPMISTIRKDLHIQEAYRIMNHLIDLNKH